MTDRERISNYLRFGEPGRFAWIDGRCVQTIDNHGFTTAPWCRLFANWDAETMSGAYLGDVTITEALSYLFGDALWFAEYVPRDDAYRIYAPEAPEDTIAYTDDLGVSLAEAQGNGKELIELL